MKQVTKILAAGALLALVGSAGVHAQAVLKIGVQAPTTGSEATYGQDMLNAAAIARDEINAHGGVLGKKIELISGDSACDPQQAVNAAAKLVSQKVVAVIGGYCSGSTVPTLKIYGDAHIPFVITAANSTALIPANPGNAFLINSTGDQQAITAVAFLKSKKLKTLAIVNEGDAYSQNLADLTRTAWQKAGDKVVDFETVNKGEQDYSAVVTAINAAHPDAVFWTAYYADGGLFIRQLRQSGYQGVIAVGDGSNSIKLFDIAGKAAEGVYAFSNPIAQFLPAAKTFIATYKKEFKTDPGPYAPLTYDGLQLLVWAMHKAGNIDPTAVEKALASANGEHWLTGPISFTKQHTLARSNFIVMQGKNGGWIAAK